MNNIAWLIMAGRFAQQLPDGADDCWTCFRIGDAVIFCHPERQPLYGERDWTTLKPICPTIEADRQPNIVDAWKDDLANDRPLTRAN